MWTEEHPENQNVLAEMKDPVSSGMQNGVTKLSILAEDGYMSHFTIEKLT